jgi:hypothetical protein
MKKYLLIISLFLTVSQAQAQVCVNCGSGASSKNANQVQAAPKVDLTIYPNPTAEYIGIMNDDNVQFIHVYNLVGKKIETFEAESGAKYDVRDLPNGLYLIQVVGKNNKILTTQRLHKRG